MKSWEQVTAARRGDPGYRQRIDAAKREALGEIREYHLGELRRILQLTQEELAARIGADQSRVSRVECGVDMRLSTLRAYVEGLGGQVRVMVDLPGQDSIPLAI